MITINEILKETQPESYNKLVKKKHSKPKKLTERELEELMKHSSYKRGTGGAIRQVR